jgi:hypothetical protein
MTQATLVEVKYTIDVMRNNVLPQSNYLGNKLNVDYIMQVEVL